MKFQFGNIVVVGDNMIGVIVKSWKDNTYDVYVRNWNAVNSFSEKDIKHYIYSKELTDEEMEFY